MFSLGVNHKQRLILNAEQITKICNAEDARWNALGFEVSTTSLTTMIAAVSEQKFYQIPFAEYVPVQAGEGAWSSNLVTFRSYEIADDFSTGIQNTGSDNARLARADSAVDSVTTQVHNWAKETGWTIMDLQMASKSGNWDLITSKEMSRKKSWDLGLQKVAFLGLAGDSNYLGLLNQPGVTVNTATLTAPITSLATSPATLSATIAQFLVDYRINSAHTAMPSHFVIPESDYLGLATASSPSFPLKSILEYMLETFKTMTMNPGFKILPCAYGDKAVSGATKQVYCLLNHDPKSVRMNVPVPYTTTLPNSLNNFNFSCVGYGTFTGVVALRPQEMLYYQF
jgi:hypothetical protein